MVVALTVRIAPEVTIRVEFTYKFKKYILTLIY